MAMSVDEILKQVKSFSREGDANELWKLLAENLNVLSDNSTRVDSVLSSLDINARENALSIVALIYVKLTVATIEALGNQKDYLFSQVQNFIDAVDKKVVQANPEVFADTLHLFTFTVIKLKFPERGIYSVREAILKIRESKNHLTTLHANLCQLCLLSNNLKPALAFLDVDTFELSIEGGTKFDVKYFLLYYYYGGMIYAAIKNYKRAAFFFEVAITVPAYALSYIMLEAYKKFLLVSLIEHGTIQVRMPPQTIVRFIKPLIKCYVDLVHAFEKGSAEEFSKVSDEHQATFVKDRNMGLVKQALAALHRKSISNLTQVFATLSLEDMARRVEMPQDKVERLLVEMIKEKKITASINEVEGIVKFEKFPQEYDTPEVQAKLEAMIDKEIKFLDVISKMDRDVTLNSKYIMKMAPPFDDDFCGQQSTSSKNN